MSVDSWLLAYQEDDQLFVQLQDSSNFFQLPMEVQEKQAIGGGTKLTVDVYSSNQFKRVVYEGLRGITVYGADVGATLEPGSQTTLLGIFSVNLKAALDALPANANSEEMP